SGESRVVGKSTYGTEENCIELTEAGNVVVVQDMPRFEKMGRGKRELLALAAKSRRRSHFVQNVERGAHHLGSNAVAGYDCNSQTFCHARFFRQQFPSELLRGSSRRASKGPVS